MTRTLDVPELSLVVLVGASGSGKSTFARRHFLPTEILSSDFCRGLVSDDENAQDATSDAFDVLHYVAAKRMARGRLTVAPGPSARSRPDFGHMCAGFWPRLGLTGATGLAAPAGPVMAVTAGPKSCQKRPALAPPGS